MALKYPKHFYEPIRIEIAVSQLKHDFRKLFPSLNEGEWRKIDSDITSWFAGENHELEEAHDFWNLFHGFARGLKLKSLLFWITAANVAWTKQEIPVKEIEITWDFPGLEFMGRAPYSAEGVIDRLRKVEMKPIKQELHRNAISRSQKFAPRDHFPIVTFYDPSGGVIGVKTGYYILEGNRRTVTAVVNDSKKILAYVGQFKNPAEDFWPENYWWPTSTLRDLIFLAIGFEKEKDQKSFDLVRKFYQLLLRDFDIARIATIDKSFKNFERDEKLLLDLILEDLK